MTLSHFHTVHKRTHQGRRLHFRAAREIHDIELETRMPLMFISILNRRFSKSFLRWFLSFCHAENLDSFLIIVDTPYLAGEACKVRRERLQQVSSEVLRRVERVSRSCPAAARPAIHTWDERARHVPQWLTSEVREAFDLGGVVTKLFHEQTRLALNLAYDHPEVPKKSRFVVTEIPLLAWEFYSPPEGVVDYYPGQQAPFFSLLETGQLTEELPKLTKLAKEAVPLVSCEISET